ncbi:MAG TPA: ATP-binding cassette domain-containing protein [Acidimicrobiales bacterium]|nr:ATP-binding cassette domain-containing protein [Acidimicrobiales bacterium]
MQSPPTTPPRPTGASPVLPGSPVAPLVEAEGLVKSFGKLNALDGLDLVVPAGQLTAVLGPNGAGKTTLIRTIATLLRPDAGSISVLGHDLRRHPEAVRRLIGLAGQSAAVEPAMTGRENLVMVARLYGQPRRAARASAAAVLDRLGLGEIAGRPVRTYSGGMRRRLDLGASLVGAPRLLLLDEPTTGLDPRSRYELWDTIRELAAAGTEILLSTQYLDEADQLASRIVIIDAGRLLAEGTPGELKSRAGMDRIEVHVREAAMLDAAIAVLAPLGTGAPEVERATRRCSVPCADGPSVLPLATSGLVAAGVALDDLTLRRPTLDEVFLALTGHGAADRGPSAKRPRSERRAGTEPATAELATTGGERR